MSRAIDMKKSIIKYLTIFVIVIIIISFTGYNLETEPPHINAISHSQLKSYNLTKNPILGVKYVNLTYGNSKAEYVIDYQIPVNSFLVGFTFGSDINIYKLNQKLNFPITGISLEIKNINVENSSSHYSILKGFASPKTRVYNTTICTSMTNRLSTAGNNSVSVSFDIVPVYNIYIYHFNGNEQYFQYNFTLKGTR
jgi:hypothetical protein